MCMPTAGLVPVSIQCCELQKSFCGCTEFEIRSPAMKPEEALTRLTAREEQQRVSSRICLGLLEDRLDPFVWSQGLSWISATCEGEQCKRPARPEITTVWMSVTRSSVWRRLQAGCFRRRLPRSYNAQHLVACTGDLSTEPGFLHMSDPQPQLAAAQHKHVNRVLQRSPKKYDISIDLAVTLLSYK